jgi:hypothetical protein
MLQPLTLRRRAPLALSFVTAALLCACGGGTTTDTSTADATETDNPSSALKLVGSKTTSPVVTANPVSSTSNPILTVPTADAPVSTTPVSGSTTTGGTITTGTAPNTLPILPVSTSPVSGGNAGQDTPTAIVTLLPAVNVAKLVRPAVGTSALNVVATAEVAPGGDGAFRTSCTVSHMAFNDPIVYPGQPGKSHLHTFFGNTGAGATTTAESLRTTGNSTCVGGIANRSAYWVPTMIDTKDGTPIAADSIGVYYKSGVITPALVNAIPVGLRMIAGDSSATVPRGDYSDFTYRFKCVGGPNNENDKYGSSIGNCDVGAQLVQEVMFPQCWDGVNLDSPDHKSHMSYTLTVYGARDVNGNLPQSQVCPATHPVVIPGISFNVLYTVTEKDAPLRWRLSSDNYDKSQPAGYSSHGDWFNGWKSDISDSWARNCIENSKDCHSHLLGDGRMVF